MTTKKMREACTDSQRNNYDLIIKPSGLKGEDVLNDESNTIQPGNGVFTTIDFFKDDYITFYTGWIINNEEAKKLVKLKAHSHVIGRNKMRDAIMGVESLEELRLFPENERGLGSFINHSSHPNIIKVMIDDHICFKCITYIPADTELFHNYGQDYWKSSYIRDEDADDFRQEIIGRNNNKTTFLLEDGRQTRSKRGGRKKSYRRRKTRRKHKSKNESRKPK